MLLDFSNSYSFLKSFKPFGQHNSRSRARIWLIQRPLESEFNFYSNEASCEMFNIGINNAIVIRITKLATTGPYQVGMGTEEQGQPFVHLITGN